MKIQDVRRPKGARKGSKRVGRGHGSGWGKTSGRGHKGAKARAGASMRIGFEGGQMPLIRRLPKRGFTNVGKKYYQVVNVESLNRFKKDASVDKSALKKARIIKREDLPVKILGNGELKKALNISVDAFSEGARSKIEKAGGKVNANKRESNANGRE